MPKRKQVVVKKSKKIFNNRNYSEKHRKVWKEV